MNDSLMHVMGRSGLKSLVGKAHLIREDISHEELIAPLLKDIEEMLLGYLRGGLFSDDVRAYAKANPDEEIPWFPAGSQRLAQRSVSIEPSPLTRRQAPAGPPEGIWAMQ